MLYSVIQKVIDILERAVTIFLCLQHTCHLRATLNWLCPRRKSLSRRRYCTNAFIMVSPDMYFWKDYISSLRFSDYCTDFNSFLLYVLQPESQLAPRKKTNQALRSGASSWIMLLCCDLRIVESISFFPFLEENFGASVMRFSSLNFIRDYCIFYLTSSKPVNCFVVCVF